MVIKKERLYWERLFYCLEWVSPDIHRDKLRRTIILKVGNGPATRAGFPLRYKKRIHC